MTMSNDDAQLLSALMDGALEADQVDRALAAACRHDGLQTWQTYQWVGMALREQRQACGPGDPAFVERLRQRLADVGSAQGSGCEPARSAAVLGQPVQLDPDRLPSAANAALFRWRLLAAAASVVAVAAVAWILVGGNAAEPAAPVLAGAPATPAVTLAAPVTVAQPTPTGMMLRDPRLDELLAAHRQAQGPSALQAPTGFLRNATWEEPRR